MNYINRKIICFFTFIFCCCVFLFLFFINFSEENSYIDKEKIINSRVMQSDIITNIKVGDVLGSYDKNNDIFYFSLSSFNYNNIEVISPYKVKYYIEKIDNEHYTIFVYSSSYYYQYNICLVKIPLINIYSFDAFNNKECDMEFDECPVGITISDYKTNNGFNFYSVLNSYGKIKVRGTTSRHFEKKSYKISVDTKTEILGLSSDNDWVLDALYSDPSKIRNKLSSDIWNKINNNQSINNDLGVEFVEVFIDNQYMGLYTIKNNVDSHVVSLDDSGLLIKAVNHFNYDYVDLLKNKNFVVAEDGSFLNMEIKKYNSNLFKEFLNKMYDYYSNNVIFDNFEQENYLNYKILISLISGDDNVTKNIYYSIDNLESRILVTPWDMDMTWGLIFDSDSSICSKKIIDNYADDFRMQYDVTYDLSDDSLQLVKQRYWELRKDVINVETINSFLDEYEKLIIDSGASQRDSCRWYNYDFKLEVGDIREWAKKRIDYLDSYFMVY